MRHRGNDANGGYSAATMDDLGQLIRSTLEASVSGVEPAGDTWSRIVQRIGAEEDRRPWHLFDGASFPWTSLVQTIVASALLLAFALGLDRGVPGRQGRTPKKPPDISLPCAVCDLQAEGDTLSGYILFRAERDGVWPGENSDDAVGSVGESALASESQQRTGLQRGAERRAARLDQY